MPLDEKDWDEAMYSLVGAGARRQPAQTDRRALKLCRSKLAAWSCLLYGRSKKPSLSTTYCTRLTMFKEHTQVVIDCGIPKLGLVPGDVGVVVHVHPQGNAYEVEFISFDGNTIGVETIEACDLHTASGNAVPHERERLVA